MAVPDLPTVEDGEHFYNLDNNGGPRQRTADASLPPNEAPQSQSCIKDTLPALFMTTLLYLVLPNAPLVLNTDNEDTLKR